MPDLVRHDMALFVEGLHNESVDLKTLKISGIKFEDILEVLSQVYLK